MMAGDEGFRAGMTGSAASGRSWVRDWGKRCAMGSSINRFTAGEDIGQGTSTWPLYPVHTSRDMVYLSADKTMKKITGIYTYRNYRGITLNPVLNGAVENTVEKDHKVIMTVGEEAVQKDDLVMPDIWTDYSLAHKDVTPQRETYQWVFQAHTAITAAVDHAAGYAAGSLSIQIDTISVGGALRPGQTISITTGGVARYYLILDIDYTVPTAALTDAVITLAWPVGTTALVNNDVITTAHAADAPIFFPFDSPWFGMLSHIETAVQQDVSVPDGDILPVVAFAAAGIANTSVAIVPSGAGAATIFTHPGGATYGTRGGIGLQLGDALETGDQLVLTAKFYDQVIRKFTVGRADNSAAARTGSGEYTDAEAALISLK